MAIVGAFDIHRSQLTFEPCRLESGESERGKIAPADRDHLRRWLTRFADERNVAFALEGCTGWRYVVEELRTGRCRSPSGGAGRYRCTSGQEASRQNRSCRHHPFAFTPSGRRSSRELDTSRALYLRPRARSASTRTCSMSAVTGINGYMRPVITRGRQSSRASTPPRAEAAGQGPALAGGRQAVEVAVRQIERLSEEMAAAAPRPGCFRAANPAARALQQAHYGVGPLTSVAIWAEMGDCRRFANSDNAVRHTGLDVTVWSSDGRQQQRPSSPTRSRRAALGALRGSHVRARLPRPTWPTTAASVTAATPSWPSSPWHANWPDAATTPSASSATSPWTSQRREHPRSPRRAQHADDLRLAPNHAPAAGSDPRPDSLERLSSRKTSHPGHPIAHHVAGATPLTAPSTEIRLGARPGPPTRDPSRCKSD